MGRNIKMEELKKISKNSLLIGIGAVLSIISLFLLFGIEWCLFYTGFSLMFSGLIRYAVEGKRKIDEQWGTDG